MLGVKIARGRARRLALYVAGSSSVNDVSLQDSDADTNDPRQSSGRQR